MKKTNCGKEDLISKDKWVDESEIQGNSSLILKSTIMNEAFEQILKLHCPKHKVALVSVCTSTRPYSKSLKWKKFKELFSDNADLIISSYGGIIPIEFEECYPYMTYDTNRPSGIDNLYIDILYERLIKFFTTHHYDYIIFNYRPSNRASNDIKVAEKFIQIFNQSECFILPSLNTYNKARQNKFKPYGGHYPDISTEVINEIITVINKVTN
jgi:predicted RNA-binding protein